jgi:hypothetical protein
MPAVVQVDGCVLQLLYSATVRVWLPITAISVFLLLAVSYMPKYEINRYDWRITNMPSRTFGIERRRLHLSKISRIFYLQDKYRNSAAAPDVPASSPKPSAPCRSAKPEPDGKGSFTGEHRNPGTAPGSGGIWVSVTSRCMRLGLTKEMQAA